MSSNDVKSILLIVNDQDLLPYKGVVESAFSDFEVIASKPSSKVEIPASAVGAIIQATDGADVWFNRVLGLDLPLVSFQSGSITDSLADRLRPEVSIEDATAKLLREIEVCSIELEIDERAEDNFSSIESVDAERAELDDMLKHRIQYAMEDLSSSGESSYTKHLLTLMTTIENPKRGITGSSLADVASCLYAAQMTRRLINKRYREVQCRPHLTQPSSTGRELPLAWEGLFSLLFSIVDFIEADEVKIKFSEDRPQVALIFDQRPDFKTAPDSLKNFHHLASRYGDVAEYVLNSAPKFGGHPLWKCEDIEPNGMRLEFYSLQRESSVES